MIALESSVGNPYVFAVAPIHMVLEMCILKR